MNASLQESSGAPSSRTAPSRPPEPSLAALALAQWPGEVALLDAGLRVQWINDRFAERLGLDAPACLGLDWLALHPTAAIHAPAYERALRGEGLELPPFPAQAPTRLGFFATTLQPLRADGGVAGVLVTERDVTDRRRIEDELARSREHFRLALECAQIGFYEWDVPADTLTGLDEWCAAHGVPPEAGRPGHDARWEALVHPDDLPPAAALFAELMNGRRDVYESEYRIRTRSGRWTWIFERSRATVRGPDGRPQRVVGICMNVDARRQAEEALRKSEFLYRTVAEFTPGYVCELARTACSQADIIWASEGFAEVYGVGLEEFKRRGWMSFMPEAEVAPSRARAERLWRGEQVASEIEIQRLDGTRRWLHVTSRPILDPASGVVQAAIGHAHDITERKLAERALRESQLQLRQIAENSTDWLLQVDRDQRIVFSNRPLQGVAPEDLVGRDAAGFAPPGDATRIREFIGAALAGLLPPTQLEQVVSDVGGHPRVMLVRAQPVHAGAAIVGVVLTVTEITRQRRDERMLRLQARILETMREGVVLVDSRNTVRLTNPAFDELFGYPQGALEGRSVEQLFRLDEATRRAADRRLRAQLAGERTEPMEFDCMRRDGTTFAAACVVTPLLIDGADHWLAVLNDVTERKLLEREILEVSNREQQRIGNDLHDGLGQELTGVALMLRSLATRIRRSHPAALGEVDEIVTLLSQSIHNARTLARGLSPVSLERGGLVPALRTLAARARETYGLSLTLRTRVTHPLRLDESAASHLYRIVQEALSNAMRHGRASQVRIQLSSDDLAIRLSVHDNGPGLPPESQLSTGLGLRTMRYRAQVVGGDLLVANHRLGGTIVRCVCPQGAREHVSLSHAHARADARAPAPLPSSRHDTRTGGPRD